MQSPGGQRLTDKELEETRFTLERVAEFVREHKDDRKMLRLTKKQVRGMGDYTN